MTVDIAVVIPVGPFPGNRRWLRECLDSVQAQTHPAAQVLLIDDQAGLPEVGPSGWLDFPEELRGERTYDLWRTPWLSGVAHAFNFGVALARTELVVMLGSDDTLEPWALEDCARAWEATHDPLGYYSLDVRYLDTGEVQTIACNAAMVSKSLWRHTGGFPVQSALGSPDAALLSIMMGAKPAGAAGNIRRVDSPMGAPYLYRQHAGTDTVRNYSRFEAAILHVRNVLTRDWQPPVWGGQAE